MSLDFNNVTLLGISQTLEKFDSDFAFKKNKVISISGLLLDLDNTEGVKDIVEASELFARSTKKNLTELKVNGVSYGVGHVSSFSVEGEHIRLAEYNAELIVVEEGSLSDIILVQNELNDNNLSINNNGIIDEDLKYLNEFSENFSFQVSAEKEVSLSHNVECSFKNRESLISLDNADWTGATVSTSKSTYLGNKGKGAILIAPNSQASIKPTGLTETEYVLEFEYLGKNTNSANWGDAWVLFVGSHESNKQLTSKGFYKVEFTPNPLTLAAGLFEIILGQDATYNTYFDNVKLYKKNDTPVQKSKALAQLLFDASPYYAVLEENEDYQESSINLFENYSISEKFDSITLAFSSEKVISHSSVIDKSSNKYSSRINTSSTFLVTGITEITENIEIKALKGMTEANLRSYIDEVEAGSSARVESKFGNYDTFVEYDCPTPTSTQTSVDAGGFSLTKKSESVNQRAGTASLTLVYDNDPRFETPQYYNSSRISISEKGGYNEIAISGSLSGVGNSNLDRYDNASSFPFTWYLETDLSNYILETKTIHSISDYFYIISKSLKSDQSSGSISYDYLYTDSKSGEYGASDIIKSYEIEVSTKSKGVVYNEFNVGCQSFAQIIGELKTPEEKTVRLSALAFYGRDPGSVLVNGTTIPLSTQAAEIYYNAKEILRGKGLLFGEESEKEKSEKTKEQWQEVNGFLTGESFTFSESEARFTYTRNTFEVGCPVTPTRTYGYQGNPLYGIITPTPNPAITPIEYGGLTAITPTDTATIEDWINILADGFHLDVPTPTPGEEWVPITPDGTTILAYLNLSPETPTPITETPTPTPTVTITVEAGTISVKRLIPENWTGTIAELFPEGDISHAVKCLDDGGQSVNIAQSYAQSMTVKDCWRGGSGSVRFSEVYFTAQDSIPTPTPLVSEPGCVYQFVEASRFYTGKIGKVFANFAEWGEPNYDDVDLVGYYLANGQFRYAEQSDLEKYVIMSDEYNDRHPNFPESGNSSHRSPDEVEVVNGTFYYRNCGSNVYSQYYMVEEVEVPTNWNKTMGELAPTSYGGLWDFSNSNGWTLQGIKTCSGDIEHMSGPPLTAFWEDMYPTARTDLTLTTLLDGCGVLSNLSQLISVYFVRAGVQ